MNVFVEPTGHTVAPFGDAPGEVLVVNKSLAHLQAQAFEEAGLTVTDELRAPTLIVPDNAYFTGGTLRQFLDAAGGKSAVCVLADSFFGKYTTPVQRDVERIDAGWRFHKVRFDDGSGAAPVDVVLDPDEKQMSIDVPEYYMGTDKLEMGIPRYPLMTIHHWCHVLWANQVAPGVEARNRPKWVWIVWGLWAALRAMSLNKWKVMAKMNRMGRKCDIHPTAIVEFCTLGEGVSIGAGAQVRFSTLGAGTHIMPGALVEFSALGDKCIVNQNSAVKFSVMYPGAISGHQLIQLSVLGREAVTTYGSNCIDMNFHQEIRVPLDGKLHSVGQRTLGCAIGHRATLGTGFWIASGRAVPNDYFVVRPPHEIIYRIPEGLAEENPLAGKDGTLVPVASLYEGGDE